MRHYLFYSIIILLFFITALSEHQEFRVLAIAGLFVLSFISVGMQES